ncbi:MAG: hypothetical protein FWB83_07605 [Treponema sp.]|nr:hypothetical protein [Treponema sp.]
MQGINFVPPHLLRRLLTFFVILAFAGCASSGGGSAGQLASVVAQAVPAEGVVVFRNTTPFTVHLVRGSGRVDAGSIAPGASLTVRNAFGVAEDYYPRFEIRMTDSWSPDPFTPEDRDFYYRVDNTHARQEIDISLPPSFSFNDVFVVFINNSRAGGVYVTRNSSNDRMTGLNFNPAKDNVNSGETIVYRQSIRELQNFRVNPGNVVFGRIEYQPGYVYTFAFDGNAVLQTDACPLNEFGAPQLVSVEFSGGDLSNAEQQEVLTALSSAITSNNVPLRLVLPADESRYQGRIFHKLRITMPIQVMPSSPQLRTTVMRVNVSIALLRGSNVIRTADLGNDSDIMRANVVRLGAALIRNASTFYQGLRTDLSR